MGLIANDLQNKLPNSRRHPAYAVIVGLLCALVLLCGSLAANEEWHYWFHSHADGGDESSCAVCLFASGGLDQSPCEPPRFTIPVGVVMELPAPPAPFLPIGFRHDFQGRGPPSLVG